MNPENNSFQDPHSRAILLCRILLWSVAGACAGFFFVFWGGLVLKKIIKQLVLLRFGSIFWEEIFKQIISYLFLLRFGSSFWKEIIKQFLSYWYLFLLRVGRSFWKEIIKQFLSYWYLLLLRFGSSFWKRSNNFLATGPFFSLCLEAAFEKDQTISKLLVPSSP